MANGSPQMDLIWECEDEQPPGLVLDVFFDELMVCLDVNDAEVAVLVTDDERVHALNKQYRDKDRTTDVLSFPNECEPPPGEARHLGDIVISYPQAMRQAAEIGQSPAEEVRFLCLHGVLHLLGYDHETDDGEMLRYQSELKQKLGKYFPEKEDQVSGRP